MQTKEQVAEAFKADLAALLARYDAELSAADHYPGWPECGEDIRMTVDIPAIYDADGNTLREQVEINLTHRFLHQPILEHPAPETNKP